MNNQIRKPLRTDTEIDAINHVNELSNLVSSLINAAVVKLDLAVEISDSDFQLMLMQIDEVIGDGFNDYIQEGKYKPRSAHSDYAEHNTLNHTQMGTTSKIWG
jgi:hypothetical protein